MKKPTTHFIAFISICLVFSLSACDLVANTLRQISNRISPTTTHGLSQSDEVGTIVAALMTKTSQLEELTNPTATYNLPSTPVPTEAPATAAPTEAVSTNEPELPPEGKVFRYKGISFTIPDELDYEITVEEHAQAQNPDNIFGGEIGAAHTLFQLTPAEPCDHLLSPEIFVFPTNSVLDIYDYWQTVFEALNILRRNGDFNSYGPLDPLPFPPIFNAGQMHHSKEKVITFQNGSGFRFLTEFHQDAMPPATESLFYAFGGVTEDQNFVVAVVIPMCKSPLPDKYEFPENVNDFYSQYDAYRIRAVNLLNETSEANFDPNLNLLDKLCESLKIDAQ